MMNAFLVTAPAATPDTSGEAILIDPGAEPERLLAAVDASGCRLTHLLATHGHFDHIAAAAAVQAAATATPLTALTALTPLTALAVPISITLPGGTGRPRL